MVTLRWHSSPAPAHMAARLSAHSEVGGGAGRCVFWERSSESHHSQPWSMEAP